MLDFAWPVWPWVVTGVSFWALDHPDSMFAVYRDWMEFGHTACWINTRIILDIMFFPVGVSMRLGAKGPLARKLDDAAENFRKIVAT